MYCIVYILSICSRLLLHSFDNFHLILFLLLSGSPPPVVIWRSNDGRIIDETYESLGPGTNVTRNGLTLARIERSHLLQEITCEAFPPLVSNGASPPSSTPLVLSSARHSSLSFIRRSSVVLDLNRK